MPKGSQAQLLMESVEYGTQTIDFTVKYTKRKTLGIEVHPDLSVWAISPTNIKIDEIKKRIAKRATWIVKQQRYFEQFLPRVPEREYVGGETHLYLGKKYMLKVRKEEHESVKMKSGELRVYTPDTSPKQVKTLLAGWYATHAQRVYREVYTHAFARFKAYKLPEPPIEIRRMKNRWGSCTPKGKIILNPELIKVPKKCIEYVLVHEMSHLMEPNHSKAFYALQSKVMPEYERWKKRLESPS